jgi:RND family efflux transporter MFP subunit
VATPSNTPKHDLGSLRISDSHRKPAGSGRKWGLIVVVILLLAGAAFGAYKFRSQKPIVEIATATKAEIGGRLAMLNASGYVTPRRRSTVAAKITGRVTGVFFDEGTHVKEGQILATLDDSDAKRALDSAKADRNASQAAIADFEVQLKNAELELHRALELQKAGVQTQQALDTAGTAADSLKAKIALAKEQVAASAARIGEAQQNVDNTVIRSPFSGIAVSKDAQVGEMVSPISAGGGFTRTGIATVVDMNSNEMELDVNESYISKVKPGGKVTAVLDAYPNNPLDGKVRIVIPTADRQKATVKVRISFDDLPKLIAPEAEVKVMPDMGVKVTFLSEAAKAPEKGAAAVLALVPQESIRTDNGSKIVFLARNGHAERRAVNVGGNRGSDVEILAGVSPGDVLITKSTLELKDGQEIEIKK